MTPEEILVYRLHRLSQIIASGAVADLLDLPLILRQLLVDGTPLIHAVNRRFRLEILFPVGSSSEDFFEWSEQNDIPLPVFYWNQDYPEEPQAHLSRDAFLKHKLVFAHGQHFTVLDVIKATANRLGGVHISNAETDDETEGRLRLLSDNLVVNGAPGTFRLLGVVARSTRDGLAELNAAAEAWVVEHRSADARFPWLADLEDKLKSKGGDA